MCWHLLCCNEGGSPKLKGNMKKLILILILAFGAVFCKSAELKFASPTLVTNAINTISVTTTNSTNFLATFVLLETNVIVVSATLDFPATAAGTANELMITATGAAQGDCVFLGVHPSAMNFAAVAPDQEPYHYFAYASNNVVIVKFVNAHVVNNHNPPSATFKAIVFKP